MYVTLPTTHLSPPQVAFIYNMAEECLWSIYWREYEIT